ncbi:Protein of unknown function [Pyronema omphalodes CBS 100304]|uniref:Uncharacterized protein n=1 Tax=Pyronema omphalodes (strain CBS 100304) TaxID=1076935 RepID=U4KUP7_PYROM|nr:Protein of unknown function [Pyronema omphalodes CBS 100304]
MSGLCNSTFRYICLYITPLHQYHLFPSSPFLCPHKTYQRNSFQDSGQPSFGFSNITTPFILRLPTSSPLGPGLNRIISSTSVGSVVLWFFALTVYLCHHLCTILLGHLDKIPR